MKNKLPFTNDQIRGWVNEHPTPFYVYNEQEIIERVRLLQQAFSWNPGFREHFAVKATPTPAIIRLLAELGCGTDCASIQEIELSLRCGVPGENIVFTANEVQPDEYRCAENAGAIINLDDITQIENMRRACGVPNTICCRYNPGSFNIDNAFMGDQTNSKFGMTRSQIFDAFAELKALGVEHFGIHSMIASCCLDETYYPSLAAELFRMVVEIKEKLDISYEFVDLSGGIGIPYAPDETEVDILAIGAGVKKAYDDILTPSGLTPSIYTELGRYITGPAGYLVTSVVGHKDTYEKYVGVDASACDLMRPAMYGAYHHMRVIENTSASAASLTADATTTKPFTTNTAPDCEGTQTTNYALSAGADADAYDVVGSLCENNDKFAIDRPLDETKTGDIIVIEDVGAHGRSMGYNYNSRLRCAEFLLTSNSSANSKAPEREKKDTNQNATTLKMIRRAETMEDYFATFDVDAEFNGKLKP